MDLYTVVLQVGLLTFSGAVYPQFDLNEHANDTDLINAIRQTPYDEGFTLTHEALKVSSFWDR